MADLARITVNLPQVLSDMASELAEQEGRSLASVCSFAIETWLHANYERRLKVYSDLRGLQTIRHSPGHYLPNPDG